MITIQRKSGPPLSCALMLVLAMNCVGEAGGTRTVGLDAQAFGQHLKTFSNDVMGARKMQDILDSDQVTSLAVIGDAVVSQLTGKLSRLFRATFDAVTNIKRHLETNYAEFDGRSTYQNCCIYESANSTFKPGFNTTVNFADMCYHVSADSDLNVTIPISEGLVNDVIANMKQLPSSTNWLMFGTEEGLSTMFPARRTNMCDQKRGQYDPRFRPWYVETATPMPKDLVVVLDRSGSMLEDNRLVLAREAARTVIGSLTPNDRTGVVVFSNEAETPPGNYKTSCYRERLAFATPGNIRYLADFIDGVAAHGGTNYTDALLKAFAFLSNSEGVTSDRRHRRKVILFLTDGEPSPLTEQIGQNILQTVSRLNRQLDNQVVLLTYGIGREITTEAEELLCEMAGLTLPMLKCSNGFTMVRSVKNLRYNLGSYYNLFSDHGRSSTPIVTTPFVSRTGLGLTVAVSLPVFWPPGELRGVAAIGLSMDELVANIAPLRQGQWQYAFVIDGSGMTLHHPLLPSRLRASGDRPLLDIADLETTKEAKLVIDSMKRGGSGRYTFLRELVTSGGDPRHDGILSSLVLAMYIWRPIAGTNLSLCVVFTIGNQQTWSYISAVSRRFVYHRLDLGHQVPLCEYDNGISTTVSSVVKFTEVAFKDPYHYFNQPEDAATVRRYENYMCGANVTSDVFKKGVRDMVAMTEKIEDFWIEVEHPAKLPRYVGMYNGVFRQFPGYVHGKPFDHTTRPWYQKAIAHGDSIILTTPYRSASSNQIILTLAKTLVRTRGGKSRPRHRVPMGVMGIDLTLCHLHKLIQDMFPVCTDDQYRCFVVDSSGYLVYHEHFISRSNEDVEYVHIAHKEADVAQDLVRIGHLTRHGCVSLLDKRLYYTWKLYGSVHNLDGTPSYQLTQVWGSNVFLGVIANDARRTMVCSSCTRQASVHRQTTVRCDHVEPRDCQCPCYEDIEFMYCVNRYRSAEHSICPLMPTSRATEDVASGPTNSTSGLAPCYRQTCVGCSECAVCREGQPCTVKSTDASQATEGSNYVSIVIATSAVVVIAVVSVVAMATVFVKWHCFLSCMNAVSSPEVMQRQLTPPPRDVLIPRAFYAANDPTHNVYLVLIPDEASATEGIYNAGINHDDLGNGIPHEEVVGTHGNSTRNSNDTALTERVNHRSGYERQVDELDSQADKSDNPVYTVEAHVSDNPGRSNTDDGNVDNVYNRFSVVIPEESEDFVWL